MKGSEDHMLTEYIFLKLDLPFVNNDRINMKKVINNWNMKNTKNKNIINFKGELIYSDNRIFNVSFVIIFETKISNELNDLK
jgi:hypothetical protein